MLFLSQNKYNLPGQLMIQALVILLIVTTSMLFFTRAYVSLSLCSDKMQKRLIAINHVLDYAQRVQYRHISLPGTTISDDITIAWKAKSNYSLLSFYNPVIKSNDTLRYIPVEVVASWRDKNGDHHYKITTGVFYEKIQ